MNPVDPVSHFLGATVSPRSSLLPVYMGESREGARRVQPLLFQETLDGPPGHTFRVPAPTVLLPAESLSDPVVITDLVVIAHKAGSQKHGAPS